MESIGERYRQVRKALGISQGDAERALMITRAYVSNIETGKRDPPDRINYLLCQRLGVNRRWLITGEGEMFEADETKSEERKREIAETLFSVQHLWSDARAEIERWTSRRVADKILSTILQEYHQLLTDEELLKLIEIREEPVDDETLGLVCLDFVERLTKIAQSNGDVIARIAELRKRGSEDGVITWALK